MSIRRGFSVALFATSLLALPAMGGQTGDEPSAPTIRVQAEGQVEAAPDRVSLSVRVVNQARQSADAAATNGKTTRAVLSALRRVTGKGAEIKTSGYSITPRFEQSKPNTPRKLVGYQVRNSITLRSDDLDGIGAAIDAATEAGANEMDSLSFEIQDDFTLKLQALAEATRRARAKADAIAKALGTSVDRVISVEEQGGTSGPLRMQARFASKGSTPVEVGNLTLRATVSMQVALED